LRSDYHAIRLDGYLGIERYPEFREAFEGPLAALPVLVDLRDGSGADSLFLSELLLFKRRHPQAVAVLIPATGNLARIFAVAGMGEKMNVFTALDDALRALGVASG
jgi:anti-anti-sigma regulatory factor